jgi:hypothetical protein
MPAMNYYDNVFQLDKDIVVKKEEFMDEKNLCP